MSRAAEPDYGLAAVRHKEVLAELHRRGQVSATALADRFGVTHETVRKDLIQLQERGLLRRVHGGAVPLESLAQETPVAARTAGAAQKARIARIARAAQRFVPDSGVLLLDSGSTTAAFADALEAGAGLLVITNSLPIAASLLPRVRRLSLLGGRVRPETEATVDHWALRALATVRADVAVLGTNAFSTANGLGTPDEAEAAVKAAMVESARLRVLLADSSKFGRESVFRYAALSDLDVVVTDDGLAPADAAALTRDFGLEVVRA